MNKLIAFVPFVLLACTSASPSPSPTTCPAGQVLGYPMGCGTSPSCVADTSGDAVVIEYCNCDGVTVRGGGQWPPAQPWASRGACGDASTDASSDASRD